MVLLSDLGHPGGEDWKRDPMDVHHPSTAAGYQFLTGPSRHPCNLIPGQGHWGTCVRRIEWGLFLPDNKIYSNYGSLHTYSLKGREKLSLLEVRAENVAGGLWASGLEECLL